MNADAPDFSAVLAAFDADALLRRADAASARDAEAALAALVRRGGHAGGAPGAGTVEELALLLAPAARPLLEPMARAARDATRRQFGDAVQLFTPLYLSNHCANRCRYCGFHARRRIPRRKLSADEIEAEARAIAATGLRQVLLLTGEAPAVAGPGYIADAARRVRPWLPSVGVEVYALSEEEYRTLVEAGVEGMTMFQETYHAPLYRELHPAGPKADFGWRLAAPARAARAGMRSLGLGALLGLDDWRRDVVRMALHAAWLARHFPAATVGFSLPRLRPCAEDRAASAEGRGEYVARPVADRDLARAMAALRLFMPPAPITLSTREPAAVRDGFAGFGVTRMSAGVSTAVGGHAPRPAPAETEGAGADADAPQFEVSDERSVDEVVAMLARQGRQAVFLDAEAPHAV